jgi:hypothetical protein
MKSRPTLHFYTPYAGTQSVVFFIAAPAPWDSLLPRLYWSFCCGCLRARSSPLHYFILSYIILTSRFISFFLLPLQQYITNTFLFSFPIITLLSIPFPLFYAFFTSSPSSLSFEFLFHPLSLYTSHTPASYCRTTRPYTAYHPLSHSGSTQQKQQKQQQERKQQSSWLHNLNHSFRAQQPRHQPWSSVHTAGRASPARSILRDISRVVRLLS